MRGLGHWRPIGFILAANCETATTDSRTYVVQPGDTLSEIAARFGVTAEAIVEANNIENPDLIEVGQVLVMPSSGGE